MREIRLSGTVRGDGESRIPTANTTSAAAEQWTLPWPRNGPRKLNKGTGFKPSKAVHRQQSQRQCAHNEQRANGRGYE